MPYTEHVSNKEILWKYKNYVTQNQKKIDETAPVYYEERGKYKSHIIQIYIEERQKVAASNLPSEFI